MYTKIKNLPIESNGSNLEGHFFVYLFKQGAAFLTGRKEWKEYYEVSDYFGDTIDHDYISYCNEIGVWKISDTLAYNADFLVKELNSISIESEYGEIISHICISPDEELFACILNESKTIIYRMSESFFDELFRINFEGRKIKCLEFSRDGRFIAFGDHRGYICVWDLLLKNQLSEIKADDYEINTLRFMKDNYTMISGGNDGLIKCWDICSGRLLKVMKNHTKPITALAIDDFSNIIISGSKDCTLKVWGLETGQLLYTLDRGDTYINNIVTTKIYDLFPICCTQSNTGELKIWDMESKALVQVITAPNDSFDGDIRFSIGSNGIFIVRVCSSGASELYALNYSNILDESEFSSDSALYCAIKGIKYQNSYSVVNSLKINTILQIQREPDNLYDSNAIAVYYSNVVDGLTKLGYIPAEVAMELSKNMDCGFKYYAKYQGYHNDYWIENKSLSGSLISIHRGDYNEQQYLSIANTYYEDLGYYSDYEYKEMDPEDFFYEHGYFPGDD